MYTFMAYMPYHYVKDFMPLLLAANLPTLEVTQVEETGGAVFDVVRKNYRHRLF